MKKAWSIVVWLLVAGALLLAAIQFVPYGRQHENPPVTAEPAWDSERTEELVRAACYDCHSNETRWPWYSHIAPTSWLLTRDVDEGREVLNFSEWSFSPEEAAFVAVAIEEVVRDGEMPPREYRLMHPEARLSEAEQQELIDGVKASLSE
ncbi:MAG TPA: heme-binding domain-containing protein [Thermoleophilia bacterium]|nr:heme-binding domain-containing protein [Thermoleophilia bacterium]